MREKDWHVLGGIGIGAFVALALFFWLFPVVREIGGMWIGGIAALALGLLFSGNWAFWSTNDDKRTAGVLGFGAWLAFVAIIFTLSIVRPDLFISIVTRAGTWIGMFVVEGLIIYGSVEAIKFKATGV